MTTNIGDDLHEVFYGPCGKMFQGPSRSIEMIKKLHKKKCELCRIAKHAQAHFGGSDKCRSDRCGMSDGIAYSKNGNLIVKPKLQNAVETAIFDVGVSGEKVIEYCKKSVY